MLQATLATAVLAASQGLSHPVLGPGALRARDRLAAHIAAHPLPLIGTPSRQVYRAAKRREAKRTVAAARAELIANRRKTKRSA